MSDTTTMLRRREHALPTTGGGMGNLDAAMDEIEDNSTDPSFEGEDDDDDDDIDDIAAEAPADPMPEMGTEMLDPPRARRSFGPIEHEDEEERGGSRRKRLGRGAPRRSPFAEQVSENFADVLASINYEPGVHKISVYRLEPEYDLDTGKRITGLCETFARQVTLEEIQKKFGGGRFKLMVTGPREDTGRGSQLKATNIVEIVGDPLTPMSAQQKKREEDRAAQDKEALVERVLERSDRRDAEYKRELREMNNTMLQMMEKVFDRPKEDPQQAASAAMTPILTMMREDSARRDREAAQQREREEQQRREDREEQRRRDEADARRHEAEMKRQDQQFQLQVEQMRAQQENVKQQQMLESANGKQQMEMMLGFMQRTDQDKETRSREQTSMQMEVMKQMSEMQRASMETQLKLVMEQLKDAKSKDGFLEALEKYQALQNILNPGEPERDTWEKVTDRFTEALPAVFTGLSAIRGSSQQQQALQPQYQQPQAGRMLPGSVAVVENYEDEGEDEGEYEDPRGTPPAGYPSQMGGDPNAPQRHEAPRFQEVDMAAKKRKLTPMNAPAEKAAQEDDRMMTNDFVEFMAYPNDASNEEVLTILAKNLDLAMQRGLDEDSMYEKCLATLPKTQKLFLKMLPVQALTAFIEHNVPNEWALRSIDGDVKLRAVHEKLVTAV